MFRSLFHLIDGYFEVTLKTLYRQNRRRICSIQDCEAEGSLNAQVWYHSAMPQTSRKMPL